MSDRYKFTAGAFARLLWDYQRIRTAAPWLGLDKDSLVPQVNLLDGNEDGEPGDGLAFRVYHTVLSLTYDGLPAIIDLSGNTGYMSGAYCVYDEFGRLFETTAIKAVCLANLGIPNGDGTYTKAPGFNAILGNPAASAAPWWGSPGVKADGTLDYAWHAVAAPGGWCGFACPNQELAVGGVATAPGSLLKVSYGGGISSTAQIDCELVLIG